MKATQFNSLWVPGQILTAAKTLVQGDAGKTIFLNLAAGFEVVLPKPKVGLSFQFVVKTAPSGGTYILSSNSDANVLIGQVYTTDVNSGTDPDFEISGADNINFVDGVAVAGDRVLVISDGTTWYCYGFCSAYNAVTFTNHSSLSVSASPSVSPSVSPS